MKPATIITSYSVAKRHSQTLGEVQKFDIVHLGRKWFDYRVTFANGKTKMIYVEKLASGKFKVWKPKAIKK